MLKVSQEIVSRMKIWLDTQQDVVDFVSKATALPHEVVLNVIDDNGMCVSARSLLGMLYAQEFKHMWLVSNREVIHTVFKEFEKA